MALDTYTNLKLELAAWTARADLTGTSGGVDTYIDLFESWANRNLRVRQMVAVNTSLTVSGTGVITHPTDWLAWKRVSIMNTPIVDLPVTSEAAALKYSNANVVGLPQKVVVQGTSSFVWPAPDATYTYKGIYYGAIPALSGSQATNWLLTAYPDAYLFGSLVLGYSYLQDDPRAGGWKSAFGQVMDEIVTASGMDEYGTAVDVPQIRNAV